MSNSINNSYDRLVVVDPGKNTVKVLDFNNEFELKNSFIFPSKTQSKRNFYDIDSSGENQYKVVYDGTSFLVGEGILGSYNFETTKNNLHHKICIYTAIAKLVEKENERIHLIVGYPSSDFANLDKRIEYINLLSSKTPIEIIINGVNKSFTIVDISVHPEGIAMRPRLLNKNRTVHIVDIGGQNINYRQYDGKGNTLTSLSLDDAGINHLETYIKTYLRKFVNADIISIESLDIIQAIKDCKIKEIDEISLNVITTYKNSKELMTDVVAKFIEEKILGQLQSKSINLYQRSHLIVFIGGGSILLEQYLKDTLVNNKDILYFSDTACWDNCISYILKDIAGRCKEANVKEQANTLASKVLQEIKKLT